VCTVLLRFAPDEPWPVLLAAVRDEFVERLWDPPEAFWDGQLLGGRDRVGGGTWLAVDPDAPAVAALLNGRHRPTEGVRPTRGRLALDILAGAGVPADLTPYDGFHLLRATTARVEVWSWDGVELVTRDLEPGDHIIVNAGPDAVGDDVVDAGRHLLASLPSEVAPGGTTYDAWGPWAELLSGPGSEGQGRLLVRHDVAGRTYGSTSVSLVGLSSTGTRYDFSAVPAGRDTWLTVLPMLN
jgi:Transport and Golgi organisation 2